MENRDDVTQKCVTSQHVMSYIKKWRDDDLVVLGAEAAINV